MFLKVLVRLRSDKVCFLNYKTTVKLKDKTEVATKPKSDPL